MGSYEQVIELASIRRAVGVTQVELANALGVGQAQVSKIERQSDMLISTLAAYLSALGVDAHLQVKTGDGTYTYDLTNGKARS